MPWLGGSEGGSGEGQWKHRATHLGNRKEAYDAGLHAIGDALEVAAGMPPAPVTIFTDA